MRTFNISTTAALALYAALILAVPLISANAVSMNTRGQPTCDNAPATAAGTTLNSPTVSTRNVVPRKSTKTVLWCAPDSQTYVVFHITRALPALVMQSMLTLSHEYALNYMQLLGDGVIPDGMVRWVGDDDLFLSVKNAANHQVTWGVLGSALVALSDYMSSFGYGAATFAIFDGLNQVGQGTIGL